MLRASARRRARPAPPGPTPSARRRCASRLARRVELAVGEALALADHRDRVGRARRLRLEAARAARRRAGYAGAGAVPLDQQLLRAPPRSAAAARASARVGLGDDALEQRPRGGRAAASMRRARRTGRWCTRATPASPSAASPQRERRGRTSPSRAPAPTARSVEPGQRAAPAAARSAARTSPGTAACGRGRAPARSSSTSCSNGRSWCA